MVNQERIRVVLLDDHEVVCLGLAARLEREANVELVGTFNSYRSLMSAIGTLNADVFLVDYALGQGEPDGVSLIRALKVQCPASRILILSSHYEPGTVALALRSGAHGFVGKSQNAGDILKAIFKVHRGAMYVDGDMSRRLAEVAIHPAQSASSHNGEQASSLSILREAKLSARESEVIRCFLDGMSVSDIAEKFHRSIKTISTQKSSAFRKLGVSTDNGLFKLFQMQGVL